VGLSSVLASELPHRESTGGLEASFEDFVHELKDLGGLGLVFRNGDRAAERAQWCALNLPRLAARRLPVPSIVWRSPSQRMNKEAGDRGLDPAAPG
jgi:hypothetical protein